jgi:hypothetical protein
LLQEACKITKLEQLSLADTIGIEMHNVVSYLSDLIKPVAKHNSITSDIQPWPAIRIL